MLLDYGLDIAGQIAVVDGNMRSATTNFPDEMRKNFLLKLRKFYSHVVTTYTHQ